MSEMDINIQRPAQRIFASKNTSYGFGLATSHAARIDFPRPRGYSDGEMISFVHAAARFCRKNTFRSAKLFFQKMDKRDTVLLLETLPNAITYYMISKCCPSLPELVSDYLVVIETMVKACEGHSDSVHKMMPQLQWIVNAVTFKDLNCDGRANASLDCIRETLQSKHGVYVQNGDKDEPPEDFRCLSVVPRQCDVIDCPTPYIRRNVLVGPYENVQHYLDVNFRMMREDMLRSFRACISICKLKLLDLHCDDMAGHLFTNVNVGFPPIYTLDGLTYRITVRAPPTEWNSVKNFRPGSLVCLSHDKFKSITFVCIREKEIISDEEVVLQVVVEHIGEELSHKTTYVLLEADVYFEPYRHVLQAVKLLNEESFPLAKSIVYLDHEESDMKHFSGSKFCLQARKVNDDDGNETGSSCSREFDIKDKTQWPSHDDLDLDEDQLKAFYLALTEKLALIHGPPGTGKTHLGCKIVQTLLDNKLEGPVMVCCATNQTLDKFLEKLLKRTRKIIRLGSQSVSEVLRPHILSNMTEALKVYRTSSGKSLRRVDPLKKEAYDLTQTICPDLFMVLPKRENEAKRNTAKGLCDSLNDMYTLYAGCKYLYLDDTVLNKIIPSNYKKKILTGAGCRADVLSSCTREWLLLSRKPTDTYEQCKNEFKAISRKRKDAEQDSNNLTETTSDDKDEEDVNIWRIPVGGRFAMLYNWRKKVLNELRSKINEQKEKYNDFIAKVQRTVQCYTANLLQCADIIGMTTCGAAKFKNLVIEAGPKVLIVEEAAEIFESHVVSALVPTIKQLILIGDHEQLRPLTATPQMGRDYFLNVSMFERLLKNGAPSVRLTQQYRMRPSIAGLLVPEFYESLTSHQSVYGLPDVVGVAKNIFFLQHYQQEDRFVSLRVSTNEYEGKFIAKLYEYLLQHGYKKSQITILTTYYGQIDIILKHLTTDSNGEEAVQIFTVDSFQGEENDIVLISFVRSNDYGQVGFVSQSNRVCVALSRAKIGLYCVGNFELFTERSDLWQTLLRKLRNSDLIGTRFPIRCRNHDEVIHIQHPDEFGDFVSRGCGETCGDVLPCGHRCESSCHFDDSDHSTVKCTAPCRKSIEIGRKTLTCRKKCWEKCLKPKKLVVVLPCGHEMRCTAEEIETVIQNNTCLEECPVILGCGHLVSVPCHARNSTNDCKATVVEALPCGHSKLVSCRQKTEGNVNSTCNVLVSTLGPCGHVVEVPCSKSESLSDLPNRCQSICGKLLECGHFCTGSCSTCCRWKIHEACREPCDLPLPCGHECEGLCNSPCPDCERTCDLRCGHSTCPNPCVRPCVKCTRPCDRGCDHRICTKQCWEPCLPCGEKCMKTLQCGHQCIGLCGQRCPDLCRYCDSAKLTSDDMENDSFVMLEDCCHVLTVDSLSSLMESAYIEREWPCCTICETPLRRNHCFDSNLKDLKSLIFEAPEVEANYYETKSMFKKTFGNMSPIRWRFHDVCGEIRSVLENGRRSTSTIFIVFHCLKTILKLHSMEELIKEYSPSLMTRFDELISWIELHLKMASYQQLEELHKAVENLENELDNATFKATTET